MKALAFICLFTINVRFKSFEIIRSQIYKQYGAVCQVYTRRLQLKRFQFTGGTVISF